jgi:hypothetical protein
MRNINQCTGRTTIFSSTLSVKMGRLCGSWRKGNGSFKPAERGGFVCTARHRNYSFNPASRPSRASPIVRENSGGNSSRAIVAHHGQAVPRPGGGVFFRRKLCIFTFVDCGTKIAS